jgi:hypothetical protein
MSLVDANAAAPIVKPFARTVAQADATRPMRPVANGLRKVLTLGNAGESWYRGLQLKAERSTSRVHSVVSYTWSRAEDLANYVLPEDSRNLAAERARADNDVRHNLSVGFTLDLPGQSRALRGWSLSGLGLFRTSRPYTVTWGNDQYGTTQNDARPGGRNTNSADAYQTIDATLSRRFGRGARRVEARVEIYNLLSTLNYSEYVGALSSPLYAQPISAFPRRRTQLAVIVRF